MANVKISQLTATTNPASSDVLPIVDVGADATKKVAISDLLENAGNGSAGAPAFAFDGDADTGMYRAAANSLGFATAGTNRLTIDSSGNVTFAKDATINGVDFGKGANSISTNTTFGSNALQANTSGHSNTATGRDALTSNTEGSTNTATGKDALKANTTGDANTANGVDALTANTEGSNNTACGSLSLPSNTTGSGNTAVGRAALNTNVSGANNVAIGRQAGFYIEGSNNTILGSRKGGTSDSGLNSTVIISAGSLERARCDSSGIWGFGGSAAAPNIALNPSGNATFNGDITCTNNSKGLVLKSPDGTSFRLSVANNGTLSATSI